MQVYMVPLNQLGGPKTKSYMEAPRSIPDAPNHLSWPHLDLKQQLLPSSPSSCQNQPMVMSFGWRPKEED